ncbi:hypothetical protein PAPYR_3506 [Paratrimastix pyriformis]|uniref:Glucodextranase-like C-terminal domain-containing protein n=1 Tax=Paratrimastix pyriformis TaxID=342808 RepID=A0ABQ8USX3_9EUKA|nr:hypothetical protein PAPYR_3506 [Paratrimastix pyriformis]
MRLAALFLGLSILSFANASDFGGVIDVNTQTHAVHIRSVSLTNLTHYYGPVEFDFTTNGCPQWRLHRMAPTGPEPVTGTFRVSLVRLFEFLPNNTALGYQPGDPVVSTWDAWRTAASDRWSWVEHTTAPGPSPVPNDTVHTIETHFVPYDTDAWAMRLVLTIASGNRSSVEGVPLDPSTLKIDLAVRGFPYTRNDSMLGLKLAVDSTLAGAPELRPTGSATPDPAGAIGGLFVAGGSFSWKAQALLDGAPAALLTTPQVLPDDAAEGIPGDPDRHPGQESRRMVVLAVPGRPQEVLWDPVLATVPTAYAGALGLRPLGRAALLLLAALLALA